MYILTHNNAGALGHGDALACGAALSNALYPPVREREYCGLVLPGCIAHRLKQQSKNNEWYSLTMTRVP